VRVPLDSAHTHARTQDEWTPYFARGTANAGRQAGRWADGQPAGRLAERQMDGRTDRWTDG
jgi:hypothetical protein